MEQRHPIIVGIGQITHRPEVREDIPHPLHLAKIAVEACVEDSECQTILNHLDSVTVVNMFSYYYEDPAGLLCEMLQINPKIREYTAIGGNTPQWLVNRAADKIMNGEIQIALLAGAEAMAGASPTKQDNWLQITDEDSSPRMVGDTRWGSTPHEELHNARYPIQVYPLYENALRAKRGLTIEEHKKFLGDYCAEFSKVASANQYAWFRKERSGEEIGTVTAQNRMIGFPYTKFMNPIMKLNQAAALIVTDTEMAKKLSIPRDKWVYLHGGADAVDRWFLSERKDYTSSPVIKEVASISLAMAEKTVDQIDLFDLYSCFPSATILQAMEIGLNMESLPPLTITGGLPYFGGPGNNYTMHAIAHAVERLRKNPEQTGYISALGWYFTKYSVGIYSGREPRQAWNRKGHEEMQKRLNDTQGPELNMNPRGAATVEAYTVMHDNSGNPEYAIIIARLKNGQRCWASTEQDHELLSAMENEEFIGKTGTVLPGDGTQNIMKF
jgi:acetyl-CoA C-acetyltransferase